MQRIAPNNQLPATHFIEVWKGDFSKRAIQAPIENINDIEFLISGGYDNISYGTTVAIFRIRENQLPTKHKFYLCK